MDGEQILYCNLNIGKVSIVQIDKDFSYYNLKSACVPDNYHHYLPEDEQTIYIFQKDFDNYDEAKEMAIIVFKNYTKILRRLLGEGANLIYNRFDVCTQAGKLIDIERNEYSETKLVSIYFSDIIRLNQQIHLNNGSRLIHYGSKILDKKTYFGITDEYIENFSKAHLKYFETLLNYVR